MQHWNLDIHEYTRENTSASEIETDFIQTMEAHQISLPLLPKLFYSTDRANNMISAFSNYNRVNDPSHILNTLGFRITNPYEDRTLSPEFILPDEIKELLIYTNGLLKLVDKIVNAVQ